jgi:hypothetical protein
LIATGRKIVAARLPDVGDRPARPIASSVIGKKGQTSKSPL